MIVLIDHDIEGQAARLWTTQTINEWAKIYPIGLLNFRDVGLAFTSSDRVVWHYAQTHDLLLLTANRNMEDADSLEQTLRDENNATSLPVLTIANIDRMTERGYREACANRLIEVVLYIEQYRGVGRLFLP